jgi:carbamoyltransferase
MTVAVLGISAQYHDAAAALIVDGRVVAAAQEERFTRVKGDASLPEHAIRWCLRSAGLTPADLSSVVFYESPFAKFDRMLSSALVGDLRAAPMFVAAMRSWLPTKLFVEQDLRRLLGKHIPVLFCDHHLSHAMSAYWPSPFANAGIVTVDGVGEWSTTTIGTGSDDEVELVEQIEFPNSLGLAYSAFTLYCGFRVNSGEYKLMGLAPYGAPRFADTILEEVIHLSDDGSFALNPAVFEYLRRPKTYNHRFEQLFGVPTRRPDDELTQHTADVAASIQEVTNRAVLGLARRAVERSGSRNIVLAGGVALNVTAVGHLERSGIVDAVWVQPAAGDAGGALGAAWWASSVHHGISRPTPVDGTSDTMCGAFLGPTPAELADPGAVVAEYGLHAETIDEPDRLAQVVADAIAGGQVVGVARGRMEFGPRALGARSVLADARDPGMQRRLNLATKFREGFRPFAPVVLAEHATAYFDTDGRESPYMLKTYPVTAVQRRNVNRDGDPGSLDVYTRVAEIRSTIPAVTHVDHSARVQTVDAARNPFLHAVLTAFHDRTGYPVLVNTSFNVRGEPIVASARDAIDCFLETDIDVLVVENFVIRRADQPAGALHARRPSAVKAD